MLKDHNLVDVRDFKGIIYELRPCETPDGRAVEGLFNAWIWLNNPAQYNSYTTEMVKETIIAFRKASMDRSVVCIIFTAVGDKAFCTGGNTKEYAEYYAGNPQEYRQYMRLFNDMVTGILMADKPVICRVNGVRLAGGQEVGMASDFSIAQDLARFGQAGPKHGSAPVGGATDFLEQFVGVENAMVGCTLCEVWSAHTAFRLGLLTEIVPGLKIDGKFTPNPLVITDRWLDPETGKIVYGEMKRGEELEKGRELMKRGEIDLSLLDRAVNRLAGKLLLSFPGCTMMTIMNLRKRKLDWWMRNSESSREWLGLNMMTEALAGFRAFNEGTKEAREVDFIRLRQRLAQGTPWTEELVRDVSPQFRKG